MSDYSSIIDHPHHRSDRRPHMSMIARAAQFSPFAALTGYDESVAETGRLTDEKIVLDSDALAALDEKIKAIVPGTSSVCVTYFVADLRKDGGSYVITSGEVKKIDTIENAIIMKDGTKIPVNDIFDIDIT